MPSALAPPQNTHTHTPPSLVFSRPFPLHPCRKTNPSCQLLLQRKCCAWYGRVPMGLEPWALGKGETEPWRCLSRSGLPHVASSCWPASVPRSSHATPAVAVKSLPDTPPPTGASPFARCSAAPPAAALSQCAVVSAPALTFAHIRGARNASCRRHVD